MLRHTVWPLLCYISMWSHYPGSLETSIEYDVNYSKFARTCKSEHTDLQNLIMTAESYLENDSKSFNSYAQLAVLGI